MSDFSVIVISLAVIVLCWAVVRINQKIDQTLRKSQCFSELEEHPDRQAERDLVRN
jgi:uncharacterized protein YoxC